MPDELEPGNLYISVRFRTAAHLCACGCGDRVVTPIKPAKWRLTYDGEKVSLSPSIGRWQQPCRSHYWLREGRVVWARAFDEDEIADVLARDARRSPRVLLGASWIVRGRGSVALVAHVAVAPREMTDDAPRTPAQPRG